MEKEDGKKHSNNLNNLELWNQISESFQLAIELLEDWAKWEGINFMEIEENYDPEKEKKKRM